MSAFIEENRARLGGEPIRRALEVSDSAYYARRTGERSAREVGVAGVAGPVLGVGANDAEGGVDALAIEGGEARASSGRVVGVEDGKRLLLGAGLGTSRV